ncbi:hypothetical protein HELRODRAFT_194308 [Helobdella robusta]|uniref:Cation efflux protein transmembrane domain-containing protein n=1 Tax=Helobdella robusta TaxID=6412 RepID=T1FVX0_HELRO|nr:hypothetical protein HELRODRAFT_194308 [Helobdella robusta]ESN92259.1 hypothetical protein HELRODRAFT_194308 [Helobdella robusta]
MNAPTKIDVPDLIGTVHPFYRENQSNYCSLKNEARKLFKQQPAKKILLSCGINIISTVILLMWCISTNSMALTAYTYLTIFDLFSMLTCLVTIWVQQQQHSSVYSFGFERFEVLFVFASTVLAQLGSFFIIKESIERVVEQPDVHTGRLLMGTVFALVFHLCIAYMVDNPAFNHVMDASSSSWLQEHVTDISESICHVVPGLSKILLPRINPFVLISLAGALALIVTHFLIDFYSYHSIDTWAAIWIALMTCGTMLPMSVYTGKILLQTTPSHLIGQLDKCLREASTLDGVLEFRHEHFWTVAFGKMAGSVHVRIRRDADEQMVLAHVYQRLSTIIPLLNVQIFKDDWLRGGASVSSSYSFGPEAKLLLLQQQSQQLQQQQMTMMSDRSLAIPSNAPTLPSNYSGMFVRPNLNFAPSSPLYQPHMPSFGSGGDGAFAAGGGGGSNVGSNNWKIPTSLLPSVENISDNDFHQHHHHDHQHHDHHHHHEQQQQHCQFHDSLNVNVGNVGNPVWQQQQNVQALFGDIKPNIRQS